MDFDEANQRLDARIGERHDTVVSFTINPDQAVFLADFVSNIPQPVLVFTEYLDDASYGDDMMDLVDRCHSGRDGGGSRCRQHPIPWQQLIEATSEVDGDPGQDVCQPGLGVDTIHLGRDDEVIHGGGTLGTAV